MEFGSKIVILFLEFIFRTLTKKWKVGFEYNIVLNDTFNVEGFGTSISGYDFTAYYCFKQCRHEKIEIGELSLTKTYKWNFDFGIGISRKNFELDVNTITYSGLKWSILSRYQWRKNYGLNAETSYTNLSKGDSSLNLLSISLGVFIFL